MKPTWDRIFDVLTQMEMRLNSENTANNMTDEEFTNLIQDLLISPDGYVIETGSRQNVSYAIAYKLIAKIKQHPILWKLFMIA